MLWVWPFSVDFNNNNFGCGTVTKKCMRAGDRKQLYYKSYMALESYLSPLCPLFLRL